MADIDVLIFGASRCGKTTLVNLLHERLDRPVIHGDVLRGTLQKELPSALNSGEESIMRFLHRYIRNCKICEKKKDTYLFELPIGGALRHVSVFHPERNIVYCLGVAELTPDKLFQNIRQNDDEWEWTYSLSDDKLHRWAETITSNSKRLRAECAEFGIPYVETSGDRPAVLAALADEICRRLERGLVGNVPSTHTHTHTE